MEECMYINHNQMASNVANTLTSHYGNLQTSTTVSYTHLTLPTNREV